MFPIWVIILGGLLIGNHYAGGEYVNNYNIVGTESLNGLNRLNDTFSSQGGYSGQIVYRAQHGTLHRAAADRGRTRPPPMSRSCRM